MKRMFRGLCLIGILLVVFVQINPVTGSSINRRVIYTAITSISFLVNYPGPELSENSTHFDFLFDFDILNPSIRKLTLPFSCQSGQLLPNISVSFENNNYTIKYLHPACLTSISHRTFDSGITSSNTWLRAAISEQNLTKLPNGEYTLWIYGRTWQQTVIFNETIMTISDEGTVIHYGTLPPLAITKQLRSLVIIHTGFVLAFFYVLIHKRKKRL